MGWLGYLVGDTNPGDPAHWIKKRADAGEIGYWDTVHKANPALHDGAGWTAAGRNYLSSLDRLKGVRRKRLLDGLGAAGEGAWFDAFDPSIHVTDRGEFDPNLAVHLAVDTGKCTGAVLFQVRGEGLEASLSVFGDYYADGLNGQQNGRAILGLCRALCRGRYDVGTYDPSGNADTGHSSTIKADFDLVGLKRLDQWPRYPGSQADGLAILESFVSISPPKLAIHPRCVNLIDALANYRRAKRGGQYVDQPVDPQHPYEDLIDPLRSGLLNKFPEGRKLDPKFMMARARSVL